jgi:putative hydrolase of the HAD superfamily
MGRLKPGLSLVFDADDTLWDSNIHFLEAEQEFVDALHDVGVETDSARVRSAIRRCELDIIRSHGYGRRQYVMALHRVTHELAPRKKLRERVAPIVEEIGERLSNRHCELLPGVEPTLVELATRHRLLLFTKGQPEEQMRKLDRSGLAPLFSAVKVTAEKDVEAYRLLIATAPLDPATSFMIGNSPRSDINPAVKAGLRAVFIAHPHTWELEHEQIDQSDERIVSILDFPGLLNMF